MARPSVFLERQSYRRRRLADAARLLPILGGGLIAIPLLWPTGDDVTEAVSMSSAIFYIFACWIGLIAVSVIFGIAAGRLSGRDAGETEPE